jgi:hypothetical protein
MSRPHARHSYVTFSHQTANEQIREAQRNAQFAGQRTLRHAVARRNRLKDLSIVLVF